MKTSTSYYLWVQACFLTTSLTHKEKGKGTLRHPINFFFFSTKLGSSVASARTSCINVADGQELLSLGNVCSLCLIAFSANQSDTSENFTGSYFNISFYFYAVFSLVHVLIFKVFKFWVIFDHSIWLASLLHVKFSSNCQENTKKKAIPGSQRWCYLSVTGMLSKYKYFVINCGIFLPFSLGF